MSNGFMSVDQFKGRFAPTMATLLFMIDFNWGGDSQGVNNDAIFMWCEPRHISIERLNKLTKKNECEDEVFRGDLIDRIEQAQTPMKTLKHMLALLND